MGVMQTIKTWFSAKTRDPTDGSVDDGIERIEVSDIIPDGQELDRDINGKLLYKQDIISDIKQKLEDRKAERQPLELQWQLNLNYYAGNQNCDINIVTGGIEQRPAPLAAMSNEVFNITAPLVETRMANLLKVTYAMTVVPRTNELDDMDKASVSTNILRYLQDTSDFNTNITNALSWSEVTGTCFFMSWWDNNAGDMVFPDESLHEGDIAWGILTPYEVYPESIFKQTIKEQRYIIVDRVMSIEDIYDVYGIVVDGRSVDVAGVTSEIGAGGFGYESAVMTVTHRSVEDAEHVITYFERPSRLYKDGRMAIIIGDELVYYGVLPYQDIPIVSIKSKDMAGQFFGRSPIQDLIPLQREYNRLKNLLHTAIGLTALGGLMAEEGSIDVDEYVDGWTQPGAIMTYHRGASPPRARESTPISPAIRDEIQNIRHDMEYMSGVSQLMATGSPPSGVKSGIAFSTLRDIDNTRMSLTGEELRQGVNSLGETWLYMYKRFAKGYRILDITGLNDIGSAVVWSSEDINSFDIRFEVENELKISEETQQEQFIAAYNMGLFTDDDGAIPQRFKVRALEMMKIGNYSAIMSEHTLHTQRAKRENTFLRKGVIPEISPLDNHSVHIEEHTRDALQYDFELFKKRNPQLAEFMISHISEHEEALEKEQANTLINKLKQMQGVGGSEQAEEPPESPTSPI